MRKFAKHEIVPHTCAMGFCNRAMTNLDQFTMTSCMSNLDYALVATCFAYPLVARVLYP